MLSDSITSQVLKFSYYLYCSVTALARCFHVLIPIKMLVEMDTKKLTFRYCNVLSEIVIAGRFLSKLCTCDIWLVDSNIVFVFFESSQCLVWSLVLARIFVAQELDSWSIL